MRVPFVFVLLTLLLGAHFLLKTSLIFIFPEKNNFLRKFHWNAHKNVSVMYTVQKPIGKRIFLPDYSIPADVHGHKSWCGYHIPCI